MSVEAELVQRLGQLEKRLAYLESLIRGPLYRGAQAGDFTTTTLPYEGDFGFQTADDELQMNCDGVILKTAMTAL